MKKERCIECHKKPIHNKKRKLCVRCYQRLRHQASTANTSLLTEDNPFAGRSEIEFIKNFFTHRDWIYHPALFRLNNEKYSPDFYDGERNMFIEVSATRQAYFFNKHKYELLRKLFPKLNFEIRKPSGELLNEDEAIHPQLLKE